MTDLEACIWHEVNDGAASPPGEGKDYPVSKGVLRYKDGDRGGWKCKEGADSCHDSRRGPNKHEQSSCEGDISMEPTQIALPVGSESVHADGADQIAFNPSRQPSKT